MNDPNMLGQETADIGQNVNNVDWFFNQNVFSNTMTPQEEPDTPEVGNLIAQMPPNEELFGDDRQDPSNRSTNIKQPESTADFLEYINSSSLPIHLKPHRPTEHFGNVLKIITIFIFTVLMANLVSWIVFVSDNEDIIPELKKKAIVLVSFSILALFLGYICQFLLELKYFRNFKPIYLPTAEQDKNIELNRLYMKLCCCLGLNLVSELVRESIFVMISISILIFLLILRLFYINKMNLDFFKSFILLLLWFSCWISFSLCFLVFSFEESKTEKVFSVLSLTVLVTKASYDISDTLLSTILIGWRIAGTTKAVLTSDLEDSSVAELPVKFCCFKASSVKFKLLFQIIIGFTFFFSLFIALLYPFSAGGLSFVENSSSLSVKVNTKTIGLVLFSYQVGVYFASIVVIIVVLISFIKHGDQDDTSEKNENQEEDFWNTLPYQNENINLEEMEKNKKEIQTIPEFKRKSIIEFFTPMVPELFQSIDFITTEPEPTVDSNVIQNVINDTVDVEDIE